MPKPNPLLDVVCPECDHAGSFLISLPVRMGVRFVDGKVDRGPLSHGFDGEGVVITCAAKIDDETCEAEILTRDLSNETMMAVYDAFGDFGQGQW